MSKKDIKYVVGHILMSVINLLFLISFWELAGMRNWMCGK